ncbi:MAG TPA: signal peptidase I [Vitreimonas sp.]|nr:signal peptidase I [Vitreimonas sp.]
MVITILRRAVATVWIASICLVVLLAMVNAVGGRFGVELFAIRGGSMEPAIPLGSAVLVTPSTGTDPAIGDIVTIRADNGVVFTHRVVEVETSDVAHWLRTKGDANAAPDPMPVPFAAVIGRVVFVFPGLGYLIGLLSTTLGLVSIMAYAVAALLIIWLLEEAEEGSAAKHSLRSQHVAVP